MTLIGILPLVFQKNKGQRRVTGHDRLGTRYRDTGVRRLLGREQYWCIPRGSNDRFGWIQPNALVRFLPHIVDYLLSTLKEGEKREPGGRYEQSNCLVPKHRIGTQIGRPRPEGATFLHQMFAQRAYEVVCSISSYCTAMQPTCQSAKSLNHRLH